MDSIEAQLAAKGLVLPQPAKVPKGVVIDFAWARVHGDTVYVSGHAALAADGTLVGPFGRVGSRSEPRTSDQGCRARDRRDARQHQARDWRPRSHRSLASRRRLRARRPRVRANHERHQRLLTPAGRALRPRAGPTRPNRDGRRRHPAERSRRRCRQVALKRG